MKIQSRHEFTEYCLRRLGKPLIQINIAKEQVEDRVDDALELYRLRHFDSMEEVNLIKTVSYQEANQGYIVLPDEVIGVQEVLSIYKNSSMMNTTDLFNFEYMMAYNDYINRAGMYSAGSGYSNYYIWQVNRATIDWLVRPDQRFEYNHKTQKLNVYYDINELYETETPIVVCCYLSIGEHKNIWTDHWLREYATNLIKRQWAENLKKYGNLILPTGATLNGDAMYQEAITELQRLEEQLNKAYELPSDFFLG
jgi:hypothetical protein